LTNDTQFRIRELTDRSARRVLLATGVLSLVVFVATLLLPRSDGHLVGSDGRSYYAILRSVVFDGNLDLANEYAWIGFDPKPLTRMGLPECPFAIGTSVLWFPFFAAAHLLSLLLRGIGASVPADGLGMIYEASVCIGTIAYGTAGLLLTYGAVRRISPPHISLLSTMGMFAATPAIYYMVAEPSMSHIPSLFAVALFLRLWYPPRPNRGVWAWIGLGAVTGLVTLVRWQNAILVVIPFAELAYFAFHHEISVTRAITALALLVVASLLVFSPQSLMWLVIYGSPITMPQGGNFSQWFAPQPVAALFSRRHGLFLWHPMFAVALTGLATLWKRDRTLAGVVLAVFCAQLYINSSAVAWWAHDAYGGRRFTGTIPLLTTALATLLQKTQRRQRFYCGVLVVMCLLAAWNGMGAIQFVFSFVSRGDGLTWRELTIDRLLVPLKLLRQLSG